MSQFGQWVVIYLLVILTVTVAAVGAVYWRRQQLGLRAEQAAAYAAAHTRREGVRYPRHPFFHEDFPPSDEAHLLRFTFDLGPSLSPEQLQYVVGEALELAQLIIVRPLTPTRKNSWDDEPSKPSESVQTAIAHLEYRNPLDILIYIWAGQAAIGAIVAAAVGLNAGVQQIRRSISGTDVVKARNREMVARSNTMTNSWDVLNEVLQGRLNDGDRGRVGMAAQLISGVEYQPPVPELENPAPED